MEALHVRFGSGYLKKHRKTFMTEINEKNDDKLPFVKDINTKKIQQAVLLKYQVEDDETKFNMLQQRDDFLKRLEKCKTRQLSLVKKQTETEKCVKKFEVFAGEKESKRKRAIQRYQSELKQKMQKNLEHDILSKELESLQARHAELTEKIEDNKKYKTYLSEVIDMFPDNCLEAGESKYTSLMMRYETLTDINAALFSNLMTNADTTKDMRMEYENLKINHTANRILLTNQINELKNTREELRTRNNMIEDDLSKNGERYTDEVLKLAEIFAGINNICEKCVKKVPIPMKDMSLDDKLLAIQEFIGRKTTILKTIKNTMSDDEYQNLLSKELED